jgi:hypothetical protein
MTKDTKRKTTSPKRGTPTLQSPYSVFVSHASADSWVANQIAEAIARAGAEPWLDETDLEGGDDILERIRHGIDRCDEAIVLLSTESIKSPWVIFEIGGAYMQHKRVTPILYHVTSEGMPISGFKGIDLNKFDQFLLQLTKRIRERRRRRKGTSPT